MLITGDRLVKSFVNEDFRSAAVFEKYAIDFCCHGNVELATACEKRGVSLQSVADELSAIKGGDEAAAQPIDAWDLDRLVDHIIKRHHGFVRRMIPIIGAHTEKVARVHGEHHPEVLFIAERFRRIAEDLLGHMLKEERVLFPFISQAALADQGKIEYVPPPFGTLANPIRMMEAEHNEAGDGMYEIRGASNSFTPPEDACTTYKVTYQELEGFEEDLHQHVHLENNILFPRALEIEQRLLKVA